MIQRIQSLFLLAVVLISIALFFIPISSKTENDATSGMVSTFTLKVSGVSTVTGTGMPTENPGNYVLMILDLLILAVAAFTIFLYKNRPVQIRLCMLAGILAALQLIIIFYYSEEMGQESTRVDYLAGVYLVALQVMMLVAARRFIRKDEMLVRAADRIR